MKQYLLNIYQPAGEAPPPADLEAVMRDMRALIDDAKRTGAWVFNGGLHPPDSTTVVRVRDGRLRTTDGPFAESKEHIGGFLIVKASDLDAALEWGRRLAQVVTLPGRTTGLAIEVRPFQGEWN